jgi:hypothetical protein
VPSLEPWLASVEALPYLDRRRVLSKMPKPFPRFLYKYRSLARSTDDSATPGAITATAIDRLRDVIVESALRLSRPSEFNDPFDMSAHIVIEGTPSQKLERYRELAKSQKVPYKEIDQAVRQLFLNDHQLPEVLRKSVETHRHTTGVYSFAGDPRSILMWSHYAAENTGLCFQFEIAQDVRIFCRAVAVQYRDDYPIINWLVGFRDSVLPLLLAKHRGWEYEKETRLIIADQAAKYVQFHPAGLRSIIFGARTPNDSIDAISDLLKERKRLGNPDLSLYRARAHHRSYKITIERLAK